MIFLKLLLFFFQNLHDNLLVSYPSMLFMVFQLSRDFNAILATFSVFLVSILCIVLFFFISDLLHLSFQ